MKIGDLVRDIHTRKTYIITSTLEAAYYELDGGRCYLPEEFLEVLSESR